MSGVKGRVFTKELTNDTLTIVRDYGIKKISVFNNTEVVGTVRGDLSIGGFDSDALNVEKEVGITIETVDANTLDGITINAPADCILKILAYQ